MHRLRAIAASSNFESQVVMPGLVPGIHGLLLRHAKDVDGRNKAGHDGCQIVTDAFLP
jgi:hypothetical protein